jgi:hypothetical protein
LKSLTFYKGHALNYKGKLDLVGFYSFLINNELLNNFRGLIYLISPLILFFLSGNGQDSLNAQMRPKNEAFSDMTFLWVEINAFSSMLREMKPLTEIKLYYMTLENLNAQNYTHPSFLDLTHSMKSFISYFICTV